MRATIRSLISDTSTSAAPTLLDQSQTESASAAASKVDTISTPGALSQSAPMNAAASKSHQAQINQEALTPKLINASQTATPAASEVGSISKPGTLSQSAPKNATASMTQQGELTQEAPVTLGGMTTVAAPQPKVTQAAPKPKVQSEQKSQVEAMDIGTVLPQAQPPVTVAGKKVALSFAKNPLSEAEQTTQQRSELAQAFNTTVPEPKAEYDDDQDMNTVDMVLHIRRILGRKGGPPPTRPKSTRGGARTRASALAFDDSRKGFQEISQSIAGLNRAAAKGGITRADGKRLTLSQIKRANNSQSPIGALIGTRPVHLILVSPSEASSLKERSTPGPDGHYILKYKNNRKRKHEGDFLFRNRKKGPSIANHKESKEFYLPITPDKKKARVVKKKGK